MTERILETILDAIDFDTEDSIEMYNIMKKYNIELLEDSGFEEERECDRVSWDRYLKIQYKDKKYIISMYGTALAEISYERWTETFGYYLSDFSIDELKG